MQINPGGRLNTEDVIGRDDEIAHYWRVIERQGLVISAERRIGKTHIVLKMRDEGEADTCPSTRTSRPSTPPRSSSARSTAPLARP